MGSPRGQFSSRIGFILAASGSAVGLGNIWGFPTNAAENGGGAFVLIYFVLAFCLAYPALMAELIIGRYAKSNIVNALQKISDNKVAKIVGKVTGLYGITIATLILSFYGIIAGWMIAFFLEPLFTIIGLSDVSSWLTRFGDLRNLLLCALFILLTIGVIRAGVEQGIEKWSCRLMPSMLILMVALIIYVLFQDGALIGLKIYLVPDFQQISNPKLIASALGQAFFSLSLGVGTMLIYGSYLRPDENLPTIGVIVTIVDSSVAFLAGLLVLPALFVAQQQGLTIYSEAGNLIAGPDLIFQTLPALFQGMGLIGIPVSLVFFCLMTIAALTSSISMLEVPVSYTIEHYGVNRHSATWLIGGITFVISAIIILNFDHIFAFIVSLTTEYSQPLLGLMLCIFATWIWNRNNLLDEIRNGYPEVENSIFWKIWPGYVRYCCPVLILLMFFQTIINS
jgi:neurotransmitter:Na+ symporter, NSS family